LLPLQLKVCKEGKLILGNDVNMLLLQSNDFKLGKFILLGNDTNLLREQSNLCKLENTILSGNIVK